MSDATSPSAVTVKSWEEMRHWQAGLLERSTGHGVVHWLERIRETAPSTEAALRTWLGEQGVTGYSQLLLVHETFGYPEFMLASSDELIAGQYADRPELRPILDAVLAALPTLGEVTVQVRKTYIALVGPRRSFALVQPTTRKRVDLGLRIEAPADASRVLPARSLGSASFTARIPLASPDEVDDEVTGWLRRTYDANL
ncbi:DUF5655 domain-containing protein [Cryobacterium tepidiphilum]|nr:DUF5655 domain-containing protein [Cryobacterium tepidiphilum]